MSRLLLEKMIPGEFAALLRAASPSALRALDFGALLRRLPVLLRRWANHEGAGEVRRPLRELLPAGIVLELERSVPGAPGAAPVPPPPPGERLLELFFRQLRNPRGIFLDLRAARFRQLDSGDLLFLPSGLWVEWSAEFRRGLVDIYAGLVEENCARLAAGLRSTGLVARRPGEEAALLSLAIEHLGKLARAPNVRSAEVAEAFEKFLSGLAREGRVLPGAFAELGLCLMTLHQHLARWDSALDVAACLRRSGVAEGLLPAEDPPPA